MVLSDTTNMPALFAKHPSWHGQIDADPVLAETTRRRLFDRAVSDKALATGCAQPKDRIGDFEAPQGSACGLLANSAEPPPPSSEYG
jgi:hypothetical protein